jgi:glycosyltransferase involved in cell wall biosynthesis
MGDDTSSVCVIAKPSRGSSYVTPVNNFCSVLEPSSDNLFLLSGGDVVEDVDISDVEVRDMGDGVYTSNSILDFLIVQIHMLYFLFKLRNEVNAVYFHKGMMPLPLPVLFARILKIKTAVIKLSDFYSQRDIQEYRRIRIKIVTQLQKLSFWCAHSAIVFSKDDRKTVPNDTVFVSFSNFIDHNQFSYDTQYTDRPIEIGFVGRFTEIKRVITFSKAAIELVKEHESIQITIIGDGPQYESVAQLVESVERIQLKGWVDHDDLPEEYNKIKFLFLPSKSEGLPTTLLEAMSCGVVTIATNAGCVGEIIDDGKTGFILRDPSPSGIKNEYQRVATHRDLTDISSAARSAVIEQYSKSAAEDRFAEITKKLIE